MLLIICVSYQSQKLYFEICVTSPNALDHLPVLFFYLDLKRKICMQGIYLLVFPID